MNLSTLTAQQLVHLIEAKAHDYKRGHAAADSVAATHPEIARDYRAAADRAKAEQDAAKAELASRSTK